MEIPLSKSNLVEIKSKVLKYEIDPSVADLNWYAAAATKPPRNRACWMILDYYHVPIIATATRKGMLLPWNTVTIDLDKKHIKYWAPAAQTKTERKHHDRHPPDTRKRFIVQRHD